jgi:hypothetical protein
MIFKSIPEACWLDDYTMPDEELELQQPAIVAHAV